MGGRACLKGTVRRGVEGGAHVRGGGVGEGMRLRAIVMGGGGEGEHA